MEQDLLSEALTKTKGKMSFDEKKARTMLEEMASKFLLPFDADALECAKKYAGAWFTRRLSEKYGMISPEIFELKRNVRHENRYSNEHTQVPVPVLFSVPINGLVPTRDEKIVKVSVEVKNSGHYNVQATIPPFTREAQRAYANALTTCLDLEDAANADPLLRGVIQTTKVATPSDASYVMIWAPDTVKIEEVAPIPKDPALLLQYWGSHFLVHKWDCFGERPLDAMLREYGESFPKATMKKV